MASGRQVFLTISINGHLHVKKKACENREGFLTALRLFFPGDNINTNKRKEL
jgi:hypothetical protein